MTRAECAENYIIVHTHRSGRTLFSNMLCQALGNCATVCTCENLLTNMHRCIWIEFPGITASRHIHVRTYRNTRTDRQTDRQTGGLLDGHSYGEEMCRVQ